MSICTKLPIYTKLYLSIIFNKNWSHLNMSIVQRHVIKQLLSQYLYSMYFVNQNLKIQSILCLVCTGIEDLHDLSYNDSLNTRYIDKISHSDLIMTKVSFILQFSTIQLKKCQLYNLCFVFYNNLNKYCNTNCN